MPQRPILPKSELLALSAEKILAAKEFFPVEWLTLVMSDSHWRYAIGNPACPAGMLAYAATYGKEQGEIGRRLAAIEHPNAPADLVKEAFAERDNWPVRQAALARKDLDWEALRHDAPGFPMYEKLVLFERTDCPEWMLRIMWKLPPQKDLCGEKDINDRLRDIAQDRLRRGNMLTADELNALEARNAPSK